MYMLTYTKIFCFFRLDFHIAVRIYIHVIPFEGQVKKPGIKQTSEIIKKGFFEFHLGNACLKRSVSYFYHFLLKILTAGLRSHLKNVV